MLKIWEKIVDFIVSHIILVYLSTILVLGIVCWQLSVFKYFIGFWLICGVLTVILLGIFAVYDAIENKKPRTIEEVEIYDEQKK